MLRREELIKQIDHTLAWLVTEIRFRGYQHLYDCHIISEDFMAGLLNIVLGYALENLNYLHPNYPGIDLGDSANGIAVQVTAEKSNSKIQRTINKFIEKRLHKTYPQLYFLILDESYRPRSTFDTKGLFAFDAEEHILDFRRLVKKIRSLSTEKLEEIVEYLHKEGGTSLVLDASQRAKLFAKLRELESSISLVLGQFQRSKSAIPHPKREADRDLRKRLAELPASQSAFWTVVGEAGVGKTTLLLHLVEWCRDSDRYLPIWLDQDLFYEDGQELSQFFGCPPEELGFRLQQLADLAQKCLVLFIDTIDAILPHTHNARLASHLNRLASNAILVCSSRPSEYERLKEAGTLKDEKILLVNLSRAQVLDILDQARGEYRVQVEDLDPALIEMCQNPFILYLLLESSREESLPRISHPTITTVMQRYWDIRVERVRPQTFDADRFGGMSEDELGQAKASMAYKIADRMLKAQTHRLTLQRSEDIADKETTDRSPIRHAVYQELVTEGVIRERGLMYEVTVEFLHDSFADFVICKQILASRQRHWLSEVGWLLKNIGSPYYIPIAVRLVQQARDIGRHDVEDRTYYIMIKILEHKRKSQRMMNQSWGVTHALRELSSIWFERMCASLRRHCPQTAASSIASVLTVRHPDVVSTLTDEMHFYAYKRRFVDSLGAIGDPMAVEPLLYWLEHLLSPREDDELLETLAHALGEIGDARAQPLLMKLETDNTVPREARRAARDALWLITKRPEYSELLPYTDQEAIAGLRLYDKKDPDRYSDWRVVKRTAERIASEVKKGETVSAAVVGALIKALDHEHEDAQRGVVQALTALATGPAIKGLIVKVLDCQTPDAIRIEMVESLAQIATRGAVDPSTRWNIRSTLTRVAREDPNPQVRRVANNALRQIL